MFYQPRLFPIDIRNLAILLDNIKTHEHIKRIDLMSFLEI